MEAKETAGRKRLKTTAQVAAAVLVVLILAGLSALAWEAQGRTREDPALAIKRIRHRDAEVARSLLPMIYRYETLLRNSVAGLPYGTPQWVSSNRQFTEVQNLIADEAPALVWHRDANGNVVLVGPEMARKHLRAVIALDGTDR